MSAIKLSSLYSQNFDSLISSGSNTWFDDSTIPGWYTARTGAKNSIAAATGSSTAGNLYSFGTTGNTDRALGSIGSSDIVGGNFFWGVRLVNDTSNTITSLNINYVGEQWRNGVTGLPQTVDFQYQIGAIGLTSGTWTDFNPLDFTSPIFSTAAGAVDGNAAANRTAKSATLSDITLNPGQEIWLRWSDIDHPSNDSGLAIDDFSVTANIALPPPTVTIQATDAAASEANSDPGRFRITRTGDTSKALTVNYTIATGTSQAANGIDYTPILTAITIAAGQSFADIAIAPVDDTALEGSETVTLTLVDTANYDLGSTSTATVTIADNDTAPATRIRDIQGTSHVSPLVGTTATNVAGIVTAVRSNGFYIQDPNPDTNDATSEGIFVFRDSGTKPNVGDSVQVTGRVDEFRGSPVRDNDLSVTQINATVSGSSFIVLSTGNALPTAIVIGNGGRISPNKVIDNDAVGGNVENAGTPFDPAEDGIDFYESLEGMRVQINNAVAVGPTNDFGEIPVLADNGANAGTRTTRGGIAIEPNDFNPERIIIDDPIVANEPSVNTSDRFNGAIVGVIDYSFSNFKLLNTTPLSVTPGGLTRETTLLKGTPDRLTVASFNVENLDPGDGTTKFNNLANRIVSNLGSPDIISLEEIQDNNGPTNDSVVDASQTYQTLIAAIAAAGGPAYQFRQIDPADDRDGGELGGNIRVGFLFNPDRVQVANRPGGGSAIDTTVNSGASGPELSSSIGRILDTDLSDGDAFANSRKPLAGEFLFNGNKVFVISNHFNSKDGDRPLFGRFQPPTLTTETQRLQQARVVNNFIDRILAIDPNANVVVMGNLNDFQFSNLLATLKGDALTNLTDTLPLSEQYTYVFEGNSQALDHILVSNNLRTNAAAEIDVVHINSEFADRDSDRDPLVARFTLPNLIKGAANGDTLNGTSGNDVINGNAGNDTISGGDGNDAIDGGEGSGDRLFGGNGNDAIADPDGVFAAHGGAGNDIINITFAPTWDNNTNPEDAPRSDGKITGGYGDDTITVTMNDSRFFINLKSDEPVNPTSNDLRDGNDVITLRGSYANSMIDLGAGNDNFNGGAGGDNVTGSSGNDTLVGGGGDDFLTGGEGSDKFIYNAVSDGSDTIADFTTSDILDLATLFDNLGYNGIDPIAAGYVQFVQMGANTQVQIDSDGLTGSAGFNTLVTLNNVFTSNLTIGRNVIV